MENEDDAAAPVNAAEQHRRPPSDSAMRALQQQTPSPQVDFTVHTMEDGSQVNTRDRVCNGMEDVLYLTSLLSSPRPRKLSGTDAPRLRIPLLTCSFT